MSTHQPLKIAMVGTKGVPATFGGVERHVEEIGSRLADRGHRVTVHCRLNYSSEAKDKCEIASKKWWRYRGMDLRLLPSVGTKHLDAITHTALAGLLEIFGGNDVVHFHAIGPGALSWVPRLAGRKVVATCHGLDWQRAKWGAMATFALRAGEWCTARFPHRTVTVSKTLREHFETAQGCKAIYIPNGINLPELLAPKLITEQWGLNGDDYFLFLSRLVPEKRADVLIEAYRNLETDRKLVIAGGSSMSDDHVAHLHSLAEGDERIIFTGNVTGDPFRELMSNAYSFILPSELEGLPIVLLEALSFGRCVLSSDIPMNMEIVHGVEGAENPWGRHFKTNNAEALRAEMMWLEANPDEVKRLGEAARDRVSEHFDWDKITDTTEALYRELTARSSS